MDIYLVGGAVRDALLARDGGRTAHVDRDWVVVGATPQAMVAQGFLPVGKDFPVFLHPLTREEYALARTERKTAPGYHGFTVHADPSVTLEEDLARRDLSINAMAVALADAEHLAQARIIDPHGGRQDLQHRVLRHVTAAFAEDPVRILRLARFAARFPDFSVAPETLALMQQMVAAGEVDHLVPERVWQELSRGLMEQRPSRMFEVLRSCGALARLLPEVDRLWGVPQRAVPDTGLHLMRVLDLSARLGASLPVRFACLGHDLGRGLPVAEDEKAMDAAPDGDGPAIGHAARGARLLRGVCERWRVPRESRELAEVVAREHGNIHRSHDADPAAVLNLLERCDAIRRPERFAEVLLACECDARGQPGGEDGGYPQRPRLLTALAAARAVDTAAVAREAAAGMALDAGAPARAGLGTRIAHAVHSARCHAVANVLGRR
jgi:tRNA nucleotidyltransferase (CCA-adding enzyme)